MSIFRDRAEAGRLLGHALRRYAGPSDVLVLALPRGGLPVAYEVARALQAPLDIFLVRKIGFPGHEELAMGAIASGGTRVVYEPVVRETGISEEEFDAAAAREEEELERRERIYRGGRAPIDVRGQRVILVDDGIATGSSARAAIRALRAKQAAKIILAIPVAPAETCEELRPEVDELVCLAQPISFTAVGAWYEDFSPVSDAEVCDLLEDSKHRPIFV